MPRTWMNPTNPTNDLKEEIQARQEAITWEGVLKPCRCCGGSAQWVALLSGAVIITCGIHGCVTVEAKNFEEAKKIWNQPDFRNGR